MSRVSWLVLAVLLWTGVAGAQDAPGAVQPDTALDRLTREVAGGLRCPVCQGLSIADSPSELAQEMKGLVRERLASGESPEAVRKYFIDKYGEWVLLAPKPSGFNLLVYLLPVALVMGGGWFVWRYVRTNTGPATPEGV